MCWRTSSAVSLAEGSLERGMKWAILLKCSTTVRMTVWPLDVGRPGRCVTMGDEEQAMDEGNWLVDDDRSCSGCAQDRR